MKKLTMLAVLILCALLIAGCSNDPQQPPENTPQLTDTPQPTGTANIEKSELDMLTSAIDNGNCTLGVGFFGYIDSESDENAVREYIAESALANKYPFLLDCTPVLTEGAELYAIVPANGATAITVYRADISADGTYIDNKDAPLYVGKPGEPVVLRCNISEIYTNVLVSLTDGKQIREFRPMISLKDGRMVQEAGLYDFSVYSNANE